MRIAILLLIIAGSVKADGVDDPNFYRDFNPNNPSKKYEFFAPPAWKAKQWYNGNVQPLPNAGCVYSWQGCNRIAANIPEPSELLLLSVGAAAMCAWRRFK